MITVLSSNPTIESKTVKRPRVAFLTNRYYVAESVSSWSGLPFFMKKCLEQSGLEVIEVQVTENGNWLGWAKFLWWKWVRGRRYLRELETRRLKYSARDLERQVERSSVDVVLSPSIWMVTYLETDQPVLLWTDATFAGVQNLYESFSNLAPPSFEAGHRTEQQGLQHCALGLFSSQWAAQSAVDRYGMDARHVHVVPFGANIERSLPEEDIAGCLAARAADVCRLLFVGVDWARKGADLAVEVVSRLNERGLRAELTIMGCNAPEGRALPSCVNVVGFISKATPQGRARIEEAFRSHHLFIMPTRADCTPCVFSEANAHALPCLSTDVGGIASIIVNDRNGRSFPLSAEAAEYVDYIMALMSDRSRYETLARASWQEARDRLSWTASGHKIAGLINDLMINHERKPAA